MSRYENEFASHPGPENAADAEARMQRAFGLAMAIHEKDPLLVLSKWGQHPQFAQWGNHDRATPHFDFFKKHRGAEEPSIRIIVSEFDENNEPTNPLYTFSFNDGYVTIKPDSSGIGFTQNVLDEEFVFSVANDAETREKLREMEAAFGNAFPKGIVIPKGGEKGQLTKATKTLVSAVVEGLPYQITRRSSHWRGADGVEYQVETETDEAGVPLEVVFTRKNTSLIDQPPYSGMVVSREVEWLYAPTGEGISIVGPYIASDDNENEIINLFNEMHSISVESQAPEELDIGIDLMRDPTLLETVAREDNNIPSDEDDFF